jgi:4-methyl-5(b-hydroxyethyl)-thiazole monophosphate biosynthesis
MKTVYIFLADGFEEIEAITTTDVLRRGGVNIQSVSISFSQYVTGAHNITVIADHIFPYMDQDIILSDADMLILPGGGRGTANLNQDERLKQLLTAFAQTGKPVAAICAAPTILGGLGLLKGKKATTYPGGEKDLAGATVVEESVVVDGNIITGRGPGLTIPFALKLLEMLQGKAKSDEVAGNLLIEN